MIEQSAHDQCDRFIRKWTPFFKGIPALRLDRSWPSVGIVDLLTSPLRGMPELQPAQREVVKGAAAYLGSLAHECWMACGVDVRLSDGEGGIEISARGGSYLSEGQVFSVAIERELARILANPPREFPVLGSFSRTVSPDQNMISLFALGLVTGLSPYGDGPWLSETPDTFQSYIRKVEKNLARQCSEYYHRTFPNEQLGQVAELYLNQLIYPPALMNEHLPALNAVNGMVEFQKEFGFDNKAMMVLAQNLAQSPDDLISATGFCYYAALATSPLPPQMMAIAQSKGSYLGLHRRAMLRVRELLGFRAEWMGEGDQDPNDELRFDVETKLGFLPWVTIPKKKALSKKLMPLTFALANFDFNLANIVIDDVVAQAPGEIDLRLQKTYLQFVAGDFDGALSGLRSLLGEPGCDEDPRVLNQLGLAELTVGQLADGSRHLRAAYENLSERSIEPHRVMNDYAWSLILQSEFERAVSVIDEALQTDPCPVTPLLNKSYALRELGRLDDCAAVNNRLLKLAPLDRRVFTNLILPGLLA